MDTIPAFFVIAAYDYLCAAPAKGPKAKEMAAF